MVVTTHSVTQVTQPGTEQDMAEINEQELAAVREQLRLALEAKGTDYVYEMPKVQEEDWETGQLVLAEAGECMYVRHDLPGGPQPSCLWGHVLIGMGVEPRTLEPWEGSAITDLPVAWSDPIITAAAKVSQQEQDRGRTWGQAIGRFEDKIEELTA